MDELRVGDKVWVRGCHDNFKPRIVSLDREAGTAVVCPLFGSPVTARIEDIERSHLLKSRRTNREDLPRRRGS